MTLNLTSKGKFKLQSGHPWITKADLSDDRNLPTRPGLLHLGEHWFFYSPNSNFCLRRFGPAVRNWNAIKGEDFLQDPRKFQDIFAPYLREHLASALKTKIRLLDLHNEDLVLRWVFSENDLIPGLVVDVFGTHVVCEILTAPMEIFWPVIKPILHEVFQQHTQSEPQIHEVRTSPNRSRENLEIIPLENPPSGLWLKWNGFKWWMTPAGQQKSGAYFDQRQNHISARAYAEKMGYASAWDLCCFEGGFGLHLAAANLHVTAVDQSQAALDAFQKNLEANDLATAKVQMQKADIFEWLRERHQQGDTTDMIILDPPSFVKSKKDLKNAMRGYKELNLRAMQCLNPGGMLVTCTCSQGITDEILREIVNGAAHDCRRTVTVLAKSGASPDHAAPVSFPEGEYLRAWSLLVH